MNYMRKYVPSRGVNFILQLSFARVNSRQNLYISSDSIVGRENVFQ